MTNTHSDTECGETAIIYLANTITAAADMERVAAIVSSMGTAKATAADYFLAMAIQLSLGAHLGARPNTPRNETIATLCTVLAVLATRQIVVEMPSSPKELN